MASPSELQSLTEQLLPGLVREIGATQDEVRRASERLGRVPPALLQNGSRIALDHAITSLGKANDYIVVCLQQLYKQYPSKHGTPVERGEG
jgi:hypothetical protein